MNIWLLQASEPLPIMNNDNRLLRMGIIAKELAQRGHNIIWFANTFDHFQKKQLYEEDTIVKVKENYKIYLIHAMGYKRNISISRIINHKRIANKFRKIAKSMEKPDLIYVSFPTIDYATEAVNYGKRYNIPVIVDIRDLWPDIFYHNLPKIVSFVATPYIKWLDYKTKKVMKNAFAINSISEKMLDWGLKKGNRVKSKFDKYFYIGYDKQDIIAIDIKEVENIIDKNKFNISFFATINNQFDYNKIVELAKYLEEDKNIKINICGDGPQFNELKEKTKEVSNINMLGWVGKEKLSYILQNSKVGLAPYKNTFDFQMSVSNKFAEYISYGLPIALTSEGYMKSLLEENNCGFSTQDMKEMSKFIIKLKNDEKEYEKMSHNAENLYKDKFIAKNIYEELVNYLEELKEEIKL